MSNLAIDIILDFLFNVDTSAAGDHGIQRNHLTELFKEYGINPLMTIDEFVERLK